MAERKCQRFTLRALLTAVFVATVASAYAARAGDGLGIEDFGEELDADLPALIDADRLLLLGGGALASWVAYEVEDSEALAASLDRPWIRPIADAGNVYGDIRFLAPAAAVLWLSGGEAGRVGRDLGEGLLLNGLVVGVLKRLFGRTRPDGGRFSYPSGHTSSAMVAAPILDRRVGRGAGAAALAMGAATGLGRIEDRRHHLSDVIMGAAVGLAVGGAVIANLDDADDAKAAAPMVSFSFAF